MSETIYNRIAMLRTERSISRRQLADALGVHYQTVGYLERGEYSPSLFLALRIAEYFEVPIEVVFALRPFPAHRQLSGGSDVTQRGSQVQPRTPGGLGATVYAAVCEQIDALHATAATPHFPTSRSVHASRQHHLRVA